MNNNLFVIHTPFHKFILEYMLNNMEEFSKSNNILLVNNNKIKINDSVLWTKIFYVDEVGSSVIGSRKKSFKAIKMVENIVKDFDINNIFLSDIQWPLNNFIFKKYHYKLSIDNFPDGIGNLYIVKQSIKFKIRQIFKVFTGLLFTSPYYYYKNDVLGMYEFNRVFSLMATEIDNEISAIQIPSFVEFNFKAENLKDCLILGQPFSDLLGDKEYLNLVSNIITHIKSKGIINIDYKPHPRENIDKYSDYFLTNGVKLVKTNLSIEEYYIKNPYKEVISFYSTSLITLKLIYRNKIKCVSFNSKKIITSLSNGKEIERNVNKLFKKIGVEIKNSAE